MFIILQSLDPLPTSMLSELADAGIKTSELIVENDRIWKVNAEILENEVIRRLEEYCFSSKIDITFLPNGRRRWNDFRLLAMDMDSTLITIECIDELADLCGKKSEVSAITEMAMRGELDFTQSLKRRVGLLKGVPVSSLETVYNERLKLNPGAEELLSRARENKIQTLLMSGGFTYFTEKLKSRLELNYTFANLLGVENGLLTGDVIGRVVDAAEKRRIVESVCSDLDISPAQAIVVGDGANDLEAMSVAGLSVAYHAKPIVRRTADIALNHVGLDGLLNILD